MEDNIVDIDDKEIGNGGKVTGLFFGFILLIIAIWGVVINPMSNTISTLQNRVITLEETQKDLRERNAEINSNSRQVAEIWRELREVENLVENNIYVDSEEHGRFDERLKVLERSHNE